MRLIGYIGVLLSLPLIAVGMETPGAARWLMLAGGAVLLPLGGAWVRPRT